MLKPLSKGGVEIIKVLLLLTLSLFLFACGGAEAGCKECVKVKLIRAKHQDSPSWERIHEAFRRCQERFPLPLWLRSSEGVSFTRKDIKGQYGPFWPLFARHAQRISPVSVVYMPKEAFGWKPPVGGLATMCTYGIGKPFAMAWDYGDQAELTCHEIAHTLCWQHEHGHWSSPKAIEVMTTFLSRPKRKGWKRRRKNSRRRNGV